ncbi:TIGR03619 family F420-dependent LLM class oxidoreductase [Rhodococcus artemisiae]|uniref:TIGR03619 family F420-dependent LLM class oxidoreductase n=1 Tax=Rhodococcus artemisiae TaxID=714159 RepID=A0ABU7LB44_9NOCA|nr:TIGR03619 family F420-dependent LLM class oxidoreductase [Rhodococcus artemisiae]MEE2058544.1 TIGR03619 family F420-dependent LLM class oxidoreductase [Rhodococcus artemisiae]
MRFTLEYPSELPTAPDDFLLPEVIRAVSSKAEACGFSAVALSEHPAPSVKWHDNGGHNTLDPIAALSFMAAATEDIRLMTNLYVLPYRTPYLSAKALTSVDIISGGRLIAGVGAGYLRSEFTAVGVEFTDRAAVFDDAIATLRGIWDDPTTPRSGPGYTAVGDVWLQRPAQRPHPPLWIGGNSRAALRRVAAHGDGWMPLIVDRAMATAIRTDAIETADQFSARLAELHGRIAESGRNPESVDVQIVCPPTDLDDRHAVAAAHDLIDDLRDRGATWVVVHVDGSSPAHALRYIERFAEEFGLDPTRTEPPSTEPVTTERTS